MILIVIDVFIIIHSSSFENFLSVNRIFDKETKWGILYRYMLLWAQNKNY